VDAVDHGLADPVKIGLGPVRLAVVGQQRGQGVEVVGGQPGVGCVELTGGGEDRRALAGSLTAAAGAWPA
jgi:hypothetical protein